MASEKFENYDGLKIIQDILPGDLHILVRENSDNDDGLTKIWDYAYRNPNEALSIVGQFIHWGEPEKAQKLAQRLFDDGGEKFYLDFPGARLFIERTRNMFWNYGISDVGLTYRILAATIEKFVNAAHNKTSRSRFTEDDEYVLGGIMDKYKDLFIESMFKPGS